MLVGLWLAAVDQLVDPTLARVERARYEVGGAFRFENSDLFGLGPLVAYLREHPRGERRRTLFFGNSLVFGYSLPATAAVPAQVQTLEPDTRVFNIAINGFDTGSSYIVARAVIDSVDRLYVLLKGEGAEPNLPSLVPVDPGDLHDFKLRAPDPVEQRLEAAAGLWRLYRSTYRLQAALFGGSTRQYIYLHKGDLVRTIVRKLRAESQSDGKGREAGSRIELRAPTAAAKVSSDRTREIEERYRLLWRFATQVRRHAKRAVFLQVEGHSDPMSADDAAVFNATFAPDEEVVIVRIPASLQFDGLHLTSEGSRAFAEALVRHERLWEATRR